MENIWNFTDASFGQECIKELKFCLTKIDARRIFFIHGNSYEKLRGREQIDSILMDYEVYHHVDFAVNPEYNDILKGVKLIYNFKPDAILAVGGGSSIDTGKLLSVLPNNSELISETIRSGKVNAIRKIPFFVAPTTAGSGSEATHFAVVYIGDNKYSVASPLLLPNHCFVDSVLTWSMSPKLTAITGLDALSQAVESFWSVYATEESKRYAAESIRLNLNSFEKSVKSPDAMSREEMTTASFLAGKAINITKTTAVHAYSYYLTKRFGLPHGQSVGILLPYFIKYNMDGKVTNGYCVDIHRQRMQELCRLFSAESPDGVIRKVNGILACCGLNIPINTLLNNTKDIEEFINRVNVERLANNPVIVQNDLLKSLMEIDVFG
ncbi:MAG: phosphonoacetaldehyde reductase [Cytophagaceae bacterium]|jgi:alcohol dehydrogenase class IV|nr:phosphonoacetaldehyde reductase [Cytophagaceae bacterium]